MKLLILDSWLKEFLETSVSPKKIAECLSLSGPSVEKLEKRGNDFLYELEITTNRPDCLGVLGIAREASTILLRFGIKAKFKEPPFVKPEEEKVGLPLVVEIKNSDLCPRFTAIVLDQVKFGQSPEWLRSRLEASDIRALNNIVDISNYLMIEFGQPVHTFDYDKIIDSKMILRESKKGEKITTLDGLERTLPGGDIVIEDGGGRLIDLCGIMGGENSAIDNNTKRVLLFVQTYNAEKIRKTETSLSFRTEASARFEKGLDPELVMPTLLKGVELFKKIAGAKVVSKIFDIYPNPYKPKEIKLDLDFAQERIGIKIDASEIVKILDSLGFEIKSGSGKMLSVCVPSWRAQDISIPEDLIEEIARIYGYFRLPNVLPVGEAPIKEKNQQFYWEDRTKDALKYLGFTEIISYSMIGKEALENTGFNLEKTLKLKNPITKEMEYMRPSLVPSLLQALAQNQANQEELHLFELANVYLPKNGNKLPEENGRLVGAITKEGFSEIKGIVEALLEDFGITDFSFKPYVKKDILYHPNRTAIIETSKVLLGTIGEINPAVLAKFGIKERVVVFDLDFETLVKLATLNKTYKPIPSYPPIIEDLAFVVLPKTFVGDLIQLIKASSSIIQSVELFDSYKDTRTFQIVYQHPTKTLTDKEVGKIRKKIIETMEKKFGARIKS